MTLSPQRGGHGGLEKKVPTSRMGKTSESDMAVLGWREQKGNKVVSTVVLKPKTYLLLQRPLVFSNAALPI